VSLSAVRNLRPVNAIKAASFLALISMSAVYSERAAAKSTVQIPDGVYQPFFREPGEVDHKITSFWIDRDPVSRSDFSAFLIRNPELAKAKISRRLADSTYLELWSGQSDNSAGGGKSADDTNLPVTSVSWFVARRFCSEKKGRLPRISEWEYAAEIQSPAALALISEWYAMPASAEGLPPTISSGKRNKLGVRGMHGLVWEWVEDFASVIIQGDSRSENDTDKQLFCAAGALSARDASEYATFMRFAFRSSLRADSTARTLGFRCVYDTNPEK
jgi:sulfatase modifying factor 1